jgi:hypothetical protein
MPAMGNYTIHFLCSTVGALPKPTLGGKSVR